MIKSNLRELELYIHIPFCVQKCKYCDFLSAPATAQVQNAYMEALLAEIRAADAADCIVVSVFIGGGTPTAVDADWIWRLMDTVRECFELAQDAEITMEMNPGTVTAESLAIYRQAGINRLSIGCQSARDEELRAIGRIHNFAQFLDTYEKVRAAGFANVNVDLMSALPGQTLRDWEETLQKILSLNPQPEHISAYSLIVEEGTPFYEMYERGELDLPDEDTDREMYRKTAEILREHGYERYEISNYAKADFACRHNCGYWTRRDYLGFGIGAASLYNNTRFHNTTSLQAYLDNSLNCREDVETLNTREQMEETMFLGLRMLKGVDTQKFQENFAVTVDEIYGTQIQESISEGLMMRNESNVFLTKKGLDLSNYVMAKFLQDNG
ncbi:MAG: oxygen-independent coproporphyrinogen III oxidase [Lachnospiraceae bacterium]|nr:oxygen-independent coproporphyrinogen III oxidase [Lachnospiraceae bacterium]